MFTKEKIIKYTQIFLFLLIFHFLVATFLKYQLGMDMKISFLSHPIINLWKDFYLVFLYVLIIGYTWKNNKIHLFKNKFSYIFFTLLIISLLISIFNRNGLSGLIFGFKYDLWIFFPIIFYYILDLDKKDINQLYDFLLKLIKYVIVISLIFYVIRYFKPNALYLLGFGPIGDWGVNSYPPLLYQTGFAGVQRISGIFSGPNHLAFFFVAFGPVILLSILNKRLHFIWGILYIFLLFGSLSRSGFLAFGLEIFLLAIFIYVYYRQYRKVILYIFLVGFGLVGLLGTYLIISGKYHQIILRGSSTKGHIDKAKQAFQGIKEKPFIGHGLGTAGPASYHTKNVLIPESWWLQIFYELGILGGFVWFYFIFYIIYYLNKKKKITYPSLTKVDILNIGLSLGMIGLLFQGLVLHSFEDAMVSIPLFIIIGFLLAYYRQNDKKN